MLNLKYYPVLKQISICCLFFLMSNHVSAQEKNKLTIKIYPLSLPTNTRLGIDIPLYKNLSINTTASYYYEKIAKGGGRSNGFMGQAFINYRVGKIEKKYPVSVYLGGGYYNFNTGFSYWYERWDYDKANGRELSYVPFSTVFGGKFNTVQTIKTMGFYGELGLMGNIPIPQNKHISFGWQFGYRINPIHTAWKNLYAENHDQFDYKWYKLHFAYGPSLNTYYNGLGIGSGIKINLTVNYSF